MVPGSTQVWNSLEVAKLVVSAVTPTLLFVFGLIVARASRRVEEATWSNRKVVERRLDLHSSMAPMLNDVYCVTRTIGHFRSIDPDQLLQTKRELDRLFFANEHLFDIAFGATYREFMGACFRAWGDAGQDSKIRIDIDRLRTERGDLSPWNPDWDRLFDRPDQSVMAAQVEGYEAVMSSFAHQVGARRR